MEPLVLSTTAFTLLQMSLREVCSFDDLKELMGAYLSSGSCKEIFSVMAQVAKNIDEGRLKMKAHCPIVTDVGMRKKATRILMCYNPTWLRIGLYIVFGGDSLLPAGNDNSDQEVLFLKMVIEKQFFSHAGLAKAYAYNKLVDGLYRPGYFEALGNVILKRFLLLVLILDRAKLQSNLPIKFGIDGIDGGSPLLFSSQSSVKSSPQVIHDFLSLDVMHGEGNVLAHLVIVGYKVSYQQHPLVEYDFRVTDIFEDLRDGVCICRAIQFLQCDASILKKISVPSDNRKKQLVNCGIALQYLKKAGVRLSDEDGVTILAEDIVNGDKELVLSMLWNMFLCLQLPLLLDKMFLAEKILKIKGIDVDNSICNASTPLEMLLDWIQAICQNYDFKIDSFASLVDGKAMWYLLDYYFFKDHHCSCKKDEGTNCEESILLAINNADPIYNFILLQKLATLLGNFPEVLQISDILEHNGACNEQSVIVLLAFFSSKLTGKKTMDRLSILKLFGCNCQRSETKRSSMEWCILNSKALLKQHGADECSSEDAVRKFKAIQAWWQEMANRDDCETKSAVSALQCRLSNRNSIDTQRERAAKVIQSHFRGLIERRKLLKIKVATSFLQNVMRAWLTVNRARSFNKFSASTTKLLSYENQEHSEIFVRYLTFMVERHSFIRLKKFVMLIQRVARIWIIKKHQSKGIFTSPVISISDMVKAAIVVQSCIRGLKARSKYDCMITQLQKSENDQIKAVVKIQRGWRRFTLCNYHRYQSIAATRIQSYFHAWLMRRNFLNLRTATLKIQRNIRFLRCWRALQQYKIITRSVVIIQSCVR